MSQADMEKAYTEAVDQLARAVEANRLLTVRLEAYEIEGCRLRAGIAEIARSARYNSRMDPDLRKPPARLLELIRQTLDCLDLPVGASQDGEPPARPGVP